MDASEKAHNAAAEVVARYIAAKKKTLCHEEVEDIVLSLFGNDFDWIDYIHFFKGCAQKLLEVLAYPDIGMLIQEKMGNTLYGTLPFMLHNIVNFCSAFDSYKEAILTLYRLENYTLTENEVYNLLNTYSQKLALIVLEKDLQSQKHNA